MTKKEFKDLIEFEIYRPYREAKGRLTLFDRFWCKHLSPELNALFLIRKKQYLESLRGGINRICSRILHIKLMRKYGIHITPGTTIGRGLRIAHPTSIVITLCKIGNNFTIYQGCTIGQKYWKSGKYPEIGNDVTMYANSSIIGDVKIADGVILGANSLLIKDANEKGCYVGSPAKLLK